MPGALAFGTSALGQDDSPAGRQRALRTAIAMLSTPDAVIDTSNAYTGGRSEAILGEARWRLGGETSATIVTKVDADPVSGRLDRDRVLRSFEESCARLGVQRFSVLHLHDPYTITLRDALAPRGAIAGLRELKDAGAVTAIGIAAGPVPLLAQYVESDVFDAVLTHNRFTLIDRSAVPVLELARDRGMTIFNAAPFGGGILARGARSDATYAYVPAAPELRAWVAKVDAICARYALSVPAVALAFSLWSPMVDVTIIGIGSPARIHEARSLRATRIPPEVWDEIAALGAAPSPLNDANDFRGM